MQAIKLEATARLERNKAHRNSLRNKGFVPAVVYGKSIASKAVAVNANKLQKIISDAGANALIHLSITGDGPAETHQVLIKSVQREPIRGDLIHVDFHQVSSKDTVTATIPISLTGDAPGVAKGGLLAQQLHAIEVECQVANIPEEIMVDISNLEVGQAIILEDLVLPDGVKALGEPGAYVVSIIAERAAAEEPASEEEKEETIS
ncbi:MAG: 50S ribosomal protein L25 [Pelotomaculum sp.]|jgi:large subunit ribosomal protein L25